ncbi:MAG: hypothetical protein K2P81_06870 [Bacteriovoracaceae bacterium]|nr:hypothetical protein [Bacteriovoracaceae bacterium]
MERNLVGDEGNVHAAKAKKQSVPKAQYDELLSRYEDLNKQYQALKEGRASDPMVTEIKEAPMISNQGVDNAPRVETVDAFTGEKSSASVSEPIQPSTTSMDANDVESQLNKYRQAMAIRGTQASEAMKIYQDLAANAIPAIKVRSQLHMGEILMQQGEFDLALQAFEGVITKMAHSGVVLEALRNAVVCSEKLGLSQKKDQYLSLLRDVFQVGA